MQRVRTAPGSTNPASPELKGSGEEAGKPRARSRGAMRHNAFGCMRCDVTSLAITCFAVLWCRLDVQSHQRTSRDCMRLGLYVRLLTAKRGEPMILTVGGEKGGVGNKYPRGSPLLHAQRGRA